MSVRHDLRYALRVLRSSPGFAAMAIATIALAIGANTAMFSFLNGILLSPLPYPDPERVMLVLEKRPDGGNNGISTLNYLDWAAQNEVFEYLAAQTGWGATYTGGDEPVRLLGGRASVQYFDITGAEVVLGRKFLPGEDEPGNDDVVLLSNALWRSRFGGDPGGRRPADHARRRAAHGCRRARVERHVRPRAAADLEAARVLPGQHDARFPLVRCDRQAQGGRHTRAGARRDGRDRQAHCRGFSRLEQGLERVRESAGAANDRPTDPHGRNCAVQCVPRSFCSSAAPISRTSHLRVASHAAAR